MKREFLEWLELNKEIIDTIMSEYDKTTQGLREKRDNLKTPYLAFFSFISLPSFLLEKYFLSKKNYFNKHYYFNYPYNS